MLPQVSDTAFFFVLLFDFFCTHQEGLPFAITPQVSDTAFLPSLGVALGGRLPAAVRAGLEAAIAAHLAEAAAAVLAATTAATAEPSAPAAAATAAQPAATAASLSTEGAGQRHGGAEPPQPSGPRAPLSMGRGRAPVPRPGGRAGGPALVASAAGGGGGGVAPAPEGTVWLPVGALRDVLRRLENYGGAPGALR
jgi:hypothetical protein